MKKAAIIGGGAAGCAAAHQLALLGGWDISIFEASNQLGAGLRTMWHGGHPYTFGPRHFLTKDQKVWDYLHSICPLRSCAGHRFWTYVAGDMQFYDFPIHRDDIARMPDSGRIEAQLAHLETAPEITPLNLEEYWLARVGAILYKKFIDNYSKKMWLVDSNTQLDTFDWSPKGTPLKSGPRAAWDEALSGYPVSIYGYDRYFEYATVDTKVYLRTAPARYDLSKRRLRIGGDWHQFDLIVSTVSPDVVFDFNYGPLHYIGRDFIKLVLPVPYAMPLDVYFCYYAGQENFTRVTEFKKFTNHKDDTTLLGIEIPTRLGRHYPMPTKREMARAQRYHAMMPANVYAMGRHGSYRYGIDFAACIEQAFTLRDMVAGGGGSGVLGEKWRLL